MIGRVKDFLRIFLFRRKSRKDFSTIRTWNVARNVNVGRWNTISKRVILGENVSVGDFTYLNASKYWTTIESNVNIGSYCSIAPAVHIGAGNHDHNLVSTHPFLFDAVYDTAHSETLFARKRTGLKDKDACTEIGNDVWIGFGAIIKRGIKIGNGAVIAGGSVVVKNVPAYSIVGGNPARVIKYRTTQENIEFFEENEKDMWWNWPGEELVRNSECLYSFDEYRKILESLVEEKKK